MHVLLACRSLPHHRAGGMEWHVQDIAEGLMEAGHRVSVLTTPLPKEPVLRRLSVNGEIIEAGGAQGRYDWRFVNDCRRLVPARLREIKPDIIHAQGYAGIFLTRFLKREFPLCTTIHGTLWSETPLREGLTGGMGQRARQAWRYKHRFAFAPLWRRFLQGSPELIVDSEFTLRELARECPEAELQPRVVPLGFDMARFPLIGWDAARKKWEVREGDLLLSTVGRLEKIKGVELIVDSFLRTAPAFPRATLLVGGEGPELPALKRLAAASPHGERVRFVGRIPSEDMPSLLEATDLFLNADKGAPAFGLANAEALCQGAPVLATAVGAHPEVVANDRDGMLVPPEDDQLWQTVLEDRLYALPEPVEARPRRSELARLRFDRTKMIALLLIAYERVARTW